MNRRSFFGLFIALPAAVKAMACQFLPEQATITHTFPMNGKDVAIYLGKHNAGKACELEHVEPIYCMWNTQYRDRQSFYLYRRSLYENNPGNSRPKHQPKGIPIVGKLERGEYWYHLTEGWIVYP